MEQDGWNDNLPQATQQIPQTTVEPTEQDADTVAMRNLPQSVVQIGLGAKAIHDQQAYTQQILANLAAQVNGIALAQTSSTTTTAPSGTSRNAPKFREPRIFTGKASDVEAFLNEMIAQDPGAKFVGEIAIGTNFRIGRCTKNILFDEKIAGSFHFTPGQAYEEADNSNRSQVHWDMVNIQRPDYGGGEVYFDGKLIRRDGEFLPAQLRSLNRGRFIKR